MKKTLSTALVAGLILTGLAGCDFSSSNERPDANQSVDTLTPDNGDDSHDNDVLLPPDGDDVATTDVETDGSTDDTGVPPAWTMHEWGVNTVKPDGTSTIGSGPEKLWEAVDRKPVIYIYSDDQFAVDVAVEFNSGISTETWPVVPNSARVAWDNVQVGTKECTTTATPQPDYLDATIEPLEIYDLPSWVVEGANCLTVGDTVSKLLFYTGTFQNYVPLLDSTASIDTTDNKVSFAITNTGAQPIGPIIALYRYAESTCYNPGYCPVHTADVAIKVIDSINVSDSKTIETELFRLHRDVTAEDPYPSVEPDLPAAWADLSDQVRTMLTGVGLTNAEISVFMTAWETTFFTLVGEDRKTEFPWYDSGAFLIYLWPDARTEQMVPMTLTPAPAEKVRAIVEYQQIETTSKPL